MQPDLSLLPYDVTVPRDVDGVPVSIDLEQLPLVLRHMYLGGWRTAQEHIVPLISGMRLGKDADTIETSIRMVMTETLPSFSEDPFTPEHRQAWCLGFRVACGPAKCQAIATVGPQNRAAQGLRMIATGLGMLADAVAPVEPPAPAKPRLLPGLGAPLGRRPLRPEDFGALPASRPP